MQQKRKGCVNLLNNEICHQFYHKHEPRVNYIWVNCAIQTIFGKNIIINQISLVNHLNG